MCLKMYDLTFSLDSILMTKLVLERPQANSEAKMIYHSSFFLLCPLDGKKHSASRALGTFDPYYPPTKNTLENMSATCIYNHLRILPSVLPDQRKAHVSTHYVNLISLLAYRVCEIWRRNIKQFFQDMHWYVSCNSVLKGRYVILLVCAVLTSQLICCCEDLQDFRLCLSWMRFKQNKVHGC